MGENHHQNNYKVLCCHLVDLSEKFYLFVFYQSDSYGGFREQSLSPTPGVNVVCQYIDNDSYYLDCFLIISHKCVFLCLSAISEITLWELHMSVEGLPGCSVNTPPGTWTGSLHFPCSIV
ncbi:hypothetical protein ILYODFUR_011912 [Ilyodon furcidens]|uniref:Uncharacterized protein n=1 Tax=Ilyodon furcidens TaxID=33524 RepID=A0ABV0USB7_9TELE